MESSCPVCTAPSPVMFEVRGYEIRRCASCRHQFTAHTLSASHVQSVYGDDYFTGGGAGYPDYLSGEMLLRNQGRWYARLLRPHLSPGTILDVGAAAGFLLRGFLDEGWTGSGVEPNERMARHANETLGLTVHTGSFEQLETPERYDLISMIQVLAHFQNPRDALAKAAALLKPGGALLVETWNCESLTARMFGERWHEYSPPSVLHMFHPGSLGTLAAGAGFFALARGRPRKRIEVKHAKSALKHAGGRFFSAAASLLPEGMWLPYPGDDLFWALFKKT